jgi:hypothetical protein
MKILLTADAGEVIAARKSAAAEHDGSIGELTGC